MTVVTETAKTAASIGHVEVIAPGSFEPERHFYPKVLNAQVHPMVKHFLSLSHERWLKRYCHLHPEVDPDTLWRMVHYQPKYLHWAGADLFYVATPQGQRKMVVVETNSCPSGQKSMPVIDEFDEQSGYHTLARECFQELLKARRLPKGGLAVIYDKNAMGNSGYAAAFAEVFQEPVYMATFYADDPDPPVRFTEDGVMEVRAPEGEWVPIRAAFRYVTQKPWTRIPIDTKTLIFNSVLACLSGGRNKLVAAKAYDLLNSELYAKGLTINYPKTVMDISKEEIPLWVKRFGDKAVIKVPYSNAGQGVYTITSQEELDAFMVRDFNYDQFIVQSLIGNKSWSSRIEEQGQFFHIGTVPDKKGHIYASDLRMMICWTRKGFRPIAMYARRAKAPLYDDVTQAPSWDMLGTNLSVKLGSNAWDSDVKRLILMDRKEFNTLGVGLDDMIEGFVQTVLSVVAIDQLACQLVNAKGRFRKKLFRSLNQDEALMQELYGA